jgi:XisH protein
VEIKTFAQPSHMHSFHLAVGQYLNYRIALQSTEPQRTLILAVPEETFKKFLSRDLSKASIETYNVKILVYNVKNEVIVQWT